MYKCEQNVHMMFDMMTECSQRTANLLVSELLNMNFCCDYNIFIQYYFLNL